MTALSRIRKVNLFGIDVFAMRMDELVGFCEEHIAERTRCLLGVLNVAKAIDMRKNRKLRKSLEDADIVLADGCGIVWLTKLLGRPLPERVAGIDIMSRLLERADKKRYSVFFLGATKTVIGKVADTVKKKYPNLQIAGYRDGYFGPDEEQAIAEDIRISRADILFVGIPSPKKENFLSKWHEYMNVPVCHGVGGSFDVFAGVTKRAPVWMQRCGLEWFYRFAQEPRRLWKRYLVTNTAFVMLSLSAIIHAHFVRFFKLSQPFSGIKEY